MVSPMQNQDRCRQQFELERSLRKEILQSPKETRSSVVAAAYATLFSTFPDHSVFDTTAEERLRKGRLSAGLVAPLLPYSAQVLEVGCGRGDTLVALKALGHNCVGVEPSLHMMDMAAESDMAVQFGTAEKLVFADSCFDAVFCQEVLEHLHPDDVPLFFGEAFRVLKPGGVLSVETPNRTTGPQDISRRFTSVAEGLHLKEWTVFELVGQFTAAGFRNVQGLLSPQFLARRYQHMHRATRISARAKHLQDLLLRCVPGLALRTFIGKCIGLDDIFLFGRRPQ
jgi:ubiquinone/menaquinone biosynthesis C-methylase UbiE